MFLDTFQDLCPNLDWLDSDCVVNLSVLLAQLWLASSASAVFVNMCQWGVCVRLQKEHSPFYPSPPVTGGIGKGGGGKGVTVHSNLCMWSNWSGRVWQTINNPPAQLLFPKIAPQQQERGGLLDKGGLFASNIAAAGDDGEGKPKRLNQRGARPHLERKTVQDKRNSGQETVCGINNN